MSQEQTKLLADGLSKIAVMLQSMVEGLVSESGQPAPIEAQPLQDAEQPTPKPEKAATEAKQPKSKQITEADVRMALAAKARDGKTEQAKAIIAKYGATMVSQLDSEHYAAVISEAEGI
jgi:hypothetical protein